MTDILILYYSRDGNTRRMANQIARGVEFVDGCSAAVRTVPELNTATAPAEATPESSPPFVTRQELAACDALILGSPTRFGNMAAPLKHFLESTTDLWLSGALCDKPAAVFTSSSTQHGGQESTLFTMMLPLMHHGMVIVGLPYTEPALTNTKQGGSPYGAGQVSGAAPATLSVDEKTLCTVLGKRVAGIAARLGNQPRVTE